MAIWVVANRLRGRSWTGRPDRIGPVEVLLFVLGPGPHPARVRRSVAVGGRHGRHQLVVLGLAYLERRYAVVSLARWTLTHLANRIRSVAGVILRALPLLLIVVVLVFFTVETWQLAHELRWPVLLLGAVAVRRRSVIVFAVIRAPDQIGEIEADVDPSTIRDLVAGDALRAARARERLVLVATAVEERAPQRAHGRRRERGHPGGRS